MARKLLNKTLRIYLWCSIIILIIAVPVFYFMVRHLYIEDVDETLILNEKQFRQKYLPHLKISEIPTWNHYTKNVKITPYQNSFKEKRLFSKSSWDSLEHEMEPYRIFQSIIKIENKPYLYTAKISLVESEDLIGSTFIIFAVLISCFVLILLFVTNRFSKKIWQPFHNTLNKLKTFNLEKGHNLSFDESNVEEFNDLNHSLKQLTDQNLSVYKQQKSFIENASHELQTPLAVLKSKLDLLLQNKNITDKQAEILSSTELPLSRMTRINKNLLLLAKIENKQFSFQEKVDLTQIINDTLELLMDFYITKQISIKKELIKKWTIGCNKTLMEILISNLLINAITHNDIKGEIFIKTEENRLIIANTGKTELNREKLFKRFAISSSETANGGLGLAIIKSICSRYKWEIQYDFKDHYHNFSVAF